MNKLQNIFDTLNKEHFGGKIKIDGISWGDIESPYAKADPSLVTAGALLIKYSDNSRKKVESRSIIINNKLKGKYNEKILKETVYHEMVHYHCQNHGWRFKAHMLKYKLWNYYKKLFKVV